jgi:hypothetical protein
MNRRAVVLCSLLAMLLATGAVLSASARSPLNTATPLSLFASLADNFLQTQAGISVTNIPVFTNNTFVYTPAINRLLQLAANITDATTNRTFTGGPNGPPYPPSVFRPTFRSDGSNVFITGYVEEGDNSTSYQAIPLLLPDDLARVDSTTTNIYGVPYVIGARKGFPNFNEFTSTSVSQITRLLDIDKTAGPARSFWVTNQLYIVGVSNFIGIEAWNSYTSSYPRVLQMIAADDLRMSLTVVDDSGSNVLFTTNLSPMFAVGTNYILPSNGWAGFPNSQIPSLDVPSFQTYLTNVVFLPDMAYEQYPPGFSSAQSHPINQPLSLIPHFLLSVTNNFRFIMLDSDTGRIIDYVTFSDGDFGSVRDLTVELESFDPLGVWNTGIVRNGLYIGINNQLQISQGAISISLNEWDNNQLQQSSQQSKADAISAFNDFCNNFGTTNLVMQAPFTPTAKYLQARTWEANDPLVHSLRDDLALSPASNPVVAIIPPDRFSPTNMVALGTVGSRYHPWGFHSNPSTDPFITNPAAKDALIIDSDAWNFPTGQPLSIAWLGRVHRGTPWQTVYLKSAPVYLGAWETWTGDTNYQDALLSQPTNDWRIASLLASLLNTNSPRDLLSVNQINLANWSSTFSNGITVLTNTAAGFVSTNMDSNSPQTAVIVNGINVIRAAQLGGYFHDISAVLATPELTMNSPWLNQSLGPNGISDVAYEMIPSQILASLRNDSEGTLQENAGQVQLQFTGFDGFTYGVQASTNLSDWSTIGTGVPSNGVFTVSDPSSGGLVQKYYRSVLVP